MITGILTLWFILTAFSLIFVIWDQFTNTPSMLVMKFAWFLVILYTGVLGLFFYFLSCRQPLPNTHDQYIKAHWKQALGSEIHCVAGDATAIIITAAILHSFSLPNGMESIIEYVAAYIFGLFIFQALFMLNMFKNYYQAVVKTIFVETVSMNMIMAGMIPTIIISKYYFPEGSDPKTIVFWGIMSLATIIGFLFGYPINSFLVRKHIKHGMMSIPSKMDHSKMDHSKMDHSAMGHMEMKSLNTGFSLFLVMMTFAFLFFVTFAVGLFFPISF